MSVTLSALVTLFSTAIVQEPQPVATYRDWIVYKAQANGETICYAATEPTDRDPSSNDDVYFAVSSWKSGKASQQPSLLAGYDLRERPEPTVRVGANRWDMYVAGDEAFIESNNDESRLINAMRRGADMRVSAMSDKGTNTEYTFSLLGVTDAIRRAERECS